MTVPFLKLQLAGNGFILVDLAALPEKHKASGAGKGAQPEPFSGGENTRCGARDAERLDSSRFADVARRLCNRRFGVGATGVIFLSADNTVRIFNEKGQASKEADDALLCAARFAFDSGRITGRAIKFSTPGGVKKVDVLGAHEFRLSLGSPFALLGGRIITADSRQLVETLEIEGARAAYSAIHIHEDVIVAFPQAIATLGFPGFSALVQKAFPGRTVLPAIARAVTAETILVRTGGHRESANCSVAAASVCAGVCAGTTDPQAVVMFEYTGSDGQPDTVIAQDRDNSRRLAVEWDTGANELYVVGSGGYVFEGKFDIPPEEEL